MHRPQTQPQILYTLLDEDAVVTTEYVLRVSYTKCKGYPATWGYGGGSPGEPDHVEDVTIEEVVSVQIGDEKPFKPTNNGMLGAIRFQFDGCKAIEAECYDAAFAEREPDYDDRDE